MKATEYTITRRAAHNAALASLAANGKDGLKIWRACRRLEAIASAHATAYCNGDTVKLQTVAGIFECNYRTGDCLHEGIVNPHSPWEMLTQFVRMEITKLFGHIPAGFFVNGDPRGYSLKLDSEKTKLPEGLQTDCGGYGILAAHIE